MQGPHCIEFLTNHTDICCKYGWLELLSCDIQSRTWFMRRHNAQDTHLQIWRRCQSLGALLARSSGGTVLPVNLAPFPSNCPVFCPIDLRLPCRARTGTALHCVENISHCSEKVESVQKELKSNIYSFQSNPNSNWCFSFKQIFSRMYQRIGEHHYLP